MTTPYIAAEGASSEFDKRTETDVPAGCDTIRCHWCRMDMPTDRATRERLEKVCFPDDGVPNVKDMTAEDRTRFEAEQREPNKRTMQPITASVLMKVLYMARMACYDVLRPTCRLATMFTKWNHDCDYKLHRLMCYLYHTAEYRLIGYVGDKPNKIGPCLWTDADLGGCALTSRSSSGILSLIHI